MSSIAEAFRTGGIWMYLILLLQLISLPVILIGGALTFKRKRVPWLVWAIIPLCIIFTAAVGQSTGISEMLAALQMATPETRMKLMARGISLSLNVEVFGAVCVMLTSLASAFVLALSTLVSVPKPRRFAPVPAGIALGLGLICTIGLSVTAGIAQTGGALGTGVLLLCATLCMVMVCVMRPDEDAHMPRIASAQLGCAMLCMLALWGFGSMRAHLGVINIFSALEMASPETRISILTYGFELIETARLIGWVVAGSTILFGVVPALFSIKHAFDKRGLLSGGVSLFAGMSLVLLSVFFSSHTESRMAEQRIPMQRWTIQSAIHSPHGDTFSSKLPQMDWRPINDHGSSCVLHRQDTQWMLSEVYEKGSAWNTGACKSDPGDACQSAQGQLNGELCQKSIGMLVPHDMPAATFTDKLWSKEPQKVMLAIDAHIDGGDASRINPTFLPLLSSPLTGVSLTWLPPTTSKSRFSSMLTQDKESMYILASNEGIKKTKTLEELSELLKPLAQSGDITTLVIAPSNTMDMQEIANLCMLKIALEQKTISDPYSPETEKITCMIMDEDAVRSW